MTDKRAPDTVFTFVIHTDLVCTGNRYNALPGEWVENLSVVVNAATYAEAKQALESALGELASAKVRRMRAVKVSQRVGMFCMRCSGVMQVDFDNSWVCPTCNPDLRNAPP